MLLMLLMLIVKMMMLLGELFMAPSPNLLHSLVLGFSPRLTQDSIKTRVHYDDDEDGGNFVIAG